MREKNEVAKVSILLSASLWLVLGLLAVMLLGIGLIGIETHNRMIEVALVVSAIHMIALVALDPIADRIASSRKRKPVIQKQSMSKKRTFPKWFFTVNGVVFGLLSGCLGYTVVTAEFVMNAETYDDMDYMAIVSLLVALAYTCGYIAIGFIMDRRRNIVAEPKVQERVQEQVKACTTNDEYISCEPGVALRKEIINTWKDCGFEAYYHGKRVCLDDLCLDDLNYKIDHEAKKVYLWETKE